MWQSKAEFIARTSKHPNWVNPEEQVTHSYDRYLNGKRKNLVSLFIHIIRRGIYSDGLEDSVEAMKEDNNILKHIDLSEILIALKKKRKLDDYDQSETIATLLMSGFLDYGNQNRCQNAIETLLHRGISYKLFIKHLGDKIKSKDDLISFMMDRKKKRLSDEIEAGKHKKYEEYQSLILTKVKQLYQLDQEKLSLEQLEEKDWIKDASLKELCKFMIQSTTEREEDEEEDEEENEEENEEEE